MLFFAYDFGADGVPLRKQMGETMDSDLLYARVCGDLVFGKETTLGVVVAVEMDHAHAQRTEQTKALYDVGAAVAIVLG